MKIPWTGWLIKNRNIFLRVLEAGKSKIKVPADSVSGESPLPGSQATNFWLCPHMAKWARELSGASFIRALVPFVRAPPL